MVHCLESTDSFGDFKKMVVESLDICLYAAFNSVRCLIRRSPTNYWKLLATKEACGREPCPRKFNFPVSCRNSVRSADVHLLFASFLLDLVISIGFILDLYSCMFKLMLKPLSWSMCSPKKDIVFSTA